ncbi:hypothetical protein K6W37_17365, partial [Acetobacter senegalensis]|nr:hypothetical protein [Acetobacter senegalensis]
MALEIGLESVWSDTVGCSAVDRGAAECEGAQASAGAPALAGAFAFAEPAPVRYELAASETNVPERQAQASAVVA